MSSLTSMSSPARSVVDEARYHAVLVPVDFSASAWRVLPLAQAIASWFSVPLLPFHVDTSTPWLGDQDPDRCVPATPFGEQLAVRVVTAADPAAGVLQMARRQPHALLAMSTHGHGEVGEAAFGSVFDQVVRSGERTVLAVGPRFEPQQQARPRRIVACLAGSTTAESIVATALAWTRRCGASLELATVAADGPPLPGQRRPAQRAHERAEQLAAAGEPVTAVTLAGHRPGHDLLTYASAVPGTLLAVTTHACPALTRMFTGSVAAYLCRHSPTPVLVHPRGVS